MQEMFDAIYRRDTRWPEYTVRPIQYSEEGPAEEGAFGHQSALSSHLLALKPVVSMLANAFLHQTCTNLLNLSANMNLVSLNGPDC